MKYLLPALLFFYTAHGQARSSDLETTGDILQIGLPIATLTSSYLLDDDDTPENLRYTQFIKSFSYGLITTHFLKLTVNKRRPHGGDHRSFPSGHTFAAVSSASFIHSRFGYKYSIPAFILSGVVGYSRIHAKAHYADDVLAGAALAFLTNQYFTDPNRALNIGVSGSGVNLSIETSLDAPSAPRKNSFLDLSFLIGPTYFQHINFDTGDNATVQLSDFDQGQDHNFTSNIHLDWHLSDNHLISTILHPYEHFVSGSLTEDINCESNTFTAGTVLDVNWIQYDLDLDYLYRLPFNLSFFDLYVGAGLYTNYARWDVKAQQTNQKYSSDRLGFVGNVLGRARVRFSESFQSLVQLNWYNDSVSKYVKTRVGVDYQMNQRWSLIAQFQHYERTLTLTSFNKNKSHRRIVSQSSFNDISLGVKLAFL